MMDHSQFQQILQRYHAGTASAEEIRFVEAYYSAYDTRPDILEQLSEDEQSKLELLLYAELREQLPVVKPLRRVHFLKTPWLRYAAAVLIVFGIAAYLWNIQKQPSSVSKTEDLLPIKNDVAPGGNKATLTLADGSKIVLDDAINGTLAQQGGATIVKTSDGEIHYDRAAVESTHPVSFNTMSTPRGGQYLLVLPDGSRVWLNAASSITYPTIFKDKERRVSITGEAYFEVTKNAKKPFIVETTSQSITVLGTRFNIHAYTDEDAIRTTLLEGSVQVRTDSLVKQLTPGQQAVRTLKGIAIDNHADLDAVMSWKNGFFDFTNADLQKVMKQMERWYDIKVKYPAQIPVYKFQGQLPRDLTLSQVLRALGKSEVKFSIEGRTLVIK